MTAHLDTPTTLRVMRRMLRLRSEAAAWFLGECRAEGVAARGGALAFHVAGLRRYSGECLTELQGRAQPATAGEEAK